MSATREEAEYVFEQWHDRIVRRDAAALAELYAADAVLESPLVCRVMDAPSGVVSGTDLRRFIELAAERRPGDDDLPSLRRTGTYLFDGSTLIWEYPRADPGGPDQLDLVEVMELAGPLIRRHRIYWGWRGTEHIIESAVRRSSTAEGE